MKEITYYNSDKISKENADINIIFGERSNGKSYDIKHRKAIEHYLETGKRFMLVRRLREELTSSSIINYFADVDVKKLTNNKYNCITVFRREIYFANFDNETYKTERGEKIGYTVPLSIEQNYAGGSFLDVDTIIFEEFMSRTVYLKDEATKLMNLYCTVDRKRGTTKMWLIGNSISRVCPYIYEWNLLNIITTIKQGEIKSTYIKSAENDYVKISVEYCKDTGKSSHTIGKNKDMLNNGSWQTNPQPKLNKSKKCYDIKFRFVFEYKGFRFLSELLKDKKTSEYIWFIYPKRTEIKEKTLVFTDRIDQSKYFQRNIYLNNLPTHIQKVLSTFRENCIFYSTDICGTDFKQVIDFEIKR